MKRSIAFLLILTMIFTSVSSFAVDGDIIHTGLRKIYRHGTDEITDDLINDIENDVDISKFYRELDGKYINVEEEEKAHLTYMGELVKANGLTKPEEVEEYLSNHIATIQKNLENISISLAKDFEDIRLSDNDRLEDFENSSSALRLTSSNFSTPEPGKEVGNTKISKLNRPAGSINWKVNTSEEIVLEVEKGSLVNGGKDYLSGMDITVNPGEFLNLYAVDRDNRVVAFTSIEIEENMIRQPTVYALELVKDKHYSEPVPGTENGTTMFHDLQFQDIDADTWSVYVSDSSIAKPELDSKSIGEIYRAGDNIEVNVGSRIFLTATKDNMIKAYALIYIGEDHIKSEEDEDNNDNPMILQPGTHFSPPVKGSNVGFTKFSWLKPRNLGDDIVWRYVVSSKIIPTPELDSTIEDENLKVKVIDESRELQIATEEEILSTGGVNKNLMLLATLDDGENYKIKAYALIKADPNNVKMPNAGTLKDTNFSTPVKGSGEYTTKIESLNSSDIPEFNHWRYKLVDEDVENIEFNSVFTNSNPYSQGIDIPSAKAGDYLILAATDGYSRVKMYTTIKLEKTMIRGKNANFLVAPANYNLNEPSPGSAEGSTKFSTLDFSTNIKEADKWMIAVSSNSFGYIEMGSTVEGTTDYKIGDDIPVSINDYLLLLATDDKDKVKGFAEFRLMEKNIRGGEPAILSEGSGPGNNYIIERGLTPSTTRFKDLKFDGVFGATNWKFKWLESNLTDNELPYLNEIIPDTQYYSIYNNIGQDITVSWVSDEDRYGYILLLAVDNNGRTKGYDLIPVDSTVVKEHAPILGDDIQLEKGSTTDKINFIGLDTNKSYMYILGDYEYTTPALDDILYDGQVYEGDITVRIGQHLTLFEVDGDNKIKGFKRFVIESNDIKQGSATFSLIGDSNNWVPEGSIVNGGTGIEITLTDANWANVVEDKSIRDKLFSGLKAKTDENQWFNVITKLISDGGGISVKDNTLRFYLANTSGYDIYEDQEITLTIPPDAIEGAINPIEASGSIIIKPTITAAIYGDVIDNIVREKDIKNGGVNIVISLLDGNWVGSITKDTLIAGFEGGDNWDKIKDQYESNGSFTRNSSKEVTLTLSAVSSIDLGSSREDVNVTIPKELIQGATVDVVATPIFSIYPDVLKVEGEAVNDTVTMQAPDGKSILEGHDTWQIKLSNSSFIEDIDNSNIVISNLPRGLSYSVKRVDPNNIEIKLSGMSTSSISNEVDVTLRLKGSAVNEANSEDSDDILLKINVNEPTSFEGIGYKIENDNIYITIPDTMLDKLEYSLNSTNGINGNWDIISSASTSISSLEPVKVWVREKLQPKVFIEAINLDYAPTPKDINIEKIAYKDNGTIVKELTLSGVDNSMEYSLDGGTTWHDFTSNHINLDENNDLRFRVKAVTGNSGELPSLPTKRLNGLFLGNTSLEVGAGKISGTNTSMEYSIDSTNGVDGKWQRANAGETMIDFAKNNRVWIREGKSNINLRYLGEVTEKHIPNLYDENGNPLIEYNILETWIENKTDENLEYRINDDSWYPLNSNTKYDKVQFAAGDLDIRTKGDENTLPSPSKTFVNISSPIEPPELKGDDDEKLIYYFDGIWKELDNKFEYKIGNNGVWTFGEEFSQDDSKYESIVVYVRKKASEKTLPSIEKSISFTKNLTLENVRYNVADKVLDGVSTKVEYSVNSFKEKNGIWKSISGTSVNIEPFEGMYLWIREVNKPSTEILLVDNLTRWNEPTLAQVYYNIETNKIANQTLQNLEYRIANGQWIRIDSKSDAYGVDFKSGKFEFRQRATEDKMESQPKLKVVIKSKLSGPNIEFSDVDNEIISINTIENNNSTEWNIFEYRINTMSSEPWISGELLAREDLSGNKTVEVRIKADKNTLSSQVSTIEFKENLELEKVTLSQHIDPHELNGTTTEMEYQIYLNNGKRTGWIQCDNGNTILPTWLKKNMYNNNVEKIEIRDGREGLNEDVFTIWPTE